MTTTESPTRSPLFVHPVRVLYADTDQAGIVYHSNYLRFLEAARAELFRSRGLPYVSVEARGLVFPVVDVALRYRRPARYDDLLDVRLWVDELGGASVLFRHEIARPGDGEGEAVCLGHVRLACTSRETLRPVPIPDDVRRMLAGG